MSGLDLNTLAELYDWLDTIPFSKPKKNLARDFSDATLTAELIKYFFPSSVEMHNYPCTNALEQKKINWSILSHKVLKKLGCPLSDNTVLELASAKREAIEFFLNSLRWKIHVLLKQKKQKDSKTQERGDTKDVKKTFHRHRNNASCQCPSCRKDSSPAISDLSKVNGIDTNPEDRGSSTASRYNSGKSSKSTGRTSKSRNNQDSYESTTPDSGTDATAEDREIYVHSLPPQDSSRRKRWFRDSVLDTVPVDLYDQKIQELAEKNEEIQILNAKIQRLEYTLSFKDVTITRQEQLLQELKRNLALQSGEGRHISSTETSFPKAAKAKPSRSN